ncbi:MAG: dTDP-4-dehydrorhamnose 3,5-epimerase [Bacilli bacterium]|nr:dTDP-4-dehydrorhamnose 3,5-epimerase [Bacilli bacterium]
MSKNFVFKELELKGAYLIEPFRITDERGEFIKDYSKEIFNLNNIDYDLEEVFYTTSHKGVIRAIHFQVNKQQPKLVRCIKGEIFDVLVDLRPESKTFKKWLGFYLSEKNGLELLIPKGFGHGYLVLKDSIVSYKCAEKFYAEFDSGIIWNDPDLKIKWPIERLNCPIILSEKDKNLSTFKHYFSYDKN